jgi:hypothetical protein
MRTWQGIDTAPRDGTPVLVYCAPHCAVAVWESGHWYDPVYSDGLPALDHATHWMPLPEAPEQSRASDANDGPTAQSTASMAI